MGKTQKKQKTKPIMSKKKSIKAVMKLRLAKKFKTVVPFPNDITAIHQINEEEHTRPPDNYNSPNQLSSSTSSFGFSSGRISCVATTSFTDSNSLNTAQSRCEGKVTQRSTHSQGGAKTTKMFFTNWFFVVFMKINNFFLRLIYTSTPLHSVSGINIVPTPSFDSAELHNSDTLGDKLTQETATIKFSNQDIVESIETIKKPVLTGRRIVDICHIFKQIQKIVHDDRFGCSFVNMEFISENRNGFFSKFKFVCQMCKTTAIISSDSKEESRLPINEAITNGTVAIGIGQTQLFEFSAAIEIPCMSNTTFSRHHNLLSSSIHNLAWEEIRKAGEEEKQLVIAAGDVDAGDVDADDGIPFCTVVADGQWSKRSYKTKYDALSGVATIIGYRTKNILFIGIRNRFCIICNRAKTKNESPSNHNCFLNWTKSATCMEADGVAEGFLKSVELHGLKFKKLIGDGDSSVTKRLSEILPYGQNFLVQKIECRNHLLRNYVQKLTAMAKKTNYPIDLRKFVLNN
ncbi:hypothetical protein QTP88_015067 [Uroleucon formosanum]